MRRTKIKARKFAIRLRKRCRSYAKIKRRIKAKFDFDVSSKTLKRWWNRYKQGYWDFKDKSKRPHRLRPKISEQYEEEVVNLKKKTGWGAKKVKIILGKKGIFLSKSTIERISRRKNLIAVSPIKGEQRKWVRWERKHQNSLWQVDHSDECDAEGNWSISVEDDCSRYNFALRKTKSVTTEFVVTLLEELMEIHGKPREILTDNGSAYGGNGEGENEFDKWCAKQGIKHIRTGICRPTTTGKVERLFETIDKELPYCFNDLEYFRYRYNFVRPHDSLFGKTPAEVYFDLARFFKDLHID